MVSRNVVLAFVALLAVAACSGSSVGPASPPTGAAAASQAPSVAAATSGPSPTAAAAETPSSFTSPLYGYSLTLPPGWRAGPAVFRWDGKTAAGHEEPEVDKFGGPPSATAWAFAGPVTLDLAGFVQDRIDANVRDHGDTCPAPPEVNEPIQIGGEPGVFLAWNCGILINQAVIVHQGVGFCMVMRDRAVQAATDAGDRAIHKTLLDSVVFPS